MRFTGDIYHPGDFRMAMAQLLQVAFFGGMALSMFGKGMLPPAVGNFMSENAMLTFGVLFSCNVMSGKLINTGAFEMSYNGTPVWSKLETGRLPTAGDIVKGMERYGFTTDMKARLATCACEAGML